MPSAGRNFFFDIIEVGQEFELSGFSKIPNITFPFTPTHVMISNESNGKTLYFSFNGRDVDGILFKDESPITFDGLTLSRLHLARESGGGVATQVRVWAWRR